MSTPPYLTIDLPGIGGCFKSCNEDFQVDEIPLYEPAGTGTHIFFRIEKNGLSTTRATSKIAASLNIRPRDIGYAGLKDAQAITRQTLSIEHIDPDRLAALDLPGIRVLEVERHTNKLKLGHLAGNRFSIKVRQADDFSPARVEAILLSLIHI